MRSAPFSFVRAASLFIGSASQRFEPASFRFLLQPSFLGSFGRFGGSTRYPWNRRLLYQFHQTFQGQCTVPLLASRILRLDDNDAIT